MKSVHTIILDAGPILQNNPAVSTLLAGSENLVTTPSVISEIRDLNARSRLENTLRPFLTVQYPSPENIEFVKDFARRTGDLAVLSQTDIDVLALAYEIDCEQNGGDQRLRKAPGQTRPSRKVQGGPSKEQVDLSNVREDVSTTAMDCTDVQLASKDEEPAVSANSADGQHYSNPHPVNPQPDASSDAPSEEPAHEPVLTLRNLTISEIPVLDSHTNVTGGDNEAEHNASIEQEQSSGSDSESDSWITPSNIKKHQAADKNGATTLSGKEPIMEVATLTADYAMQNVLLQIGLYLISDSLQRVRNIRTYILRCHACFEKVKDTSKQFCPRCGKPTLTRVTCSTNSKGEFQIHLKKKMQWNHRGDRYSIPKPISGSASGKIAQGKGGGKGGWGHGLILAEDQKEYQRAISRSGKERRATDLMDEDYLPRILSGERRLPAQRPRVGAGRNVNSKKRS